MTDHIRNFCIIAHVDHGKSTLADRLLQLTGAISERDMTEQALDSMDLEREKGVTIKSSAVRMFYTSKDNQRYEMNLIDTPGHVDFGYEVSRALKACEGAILVVDATQGIEAQTLANLYQALEADLTIVPVINKIDLPSARPDEVAEDVGSLLGVDPDDVLRVSAKEGINIEQILEEIVKRVPPPKDVDNKPVRALIFDAHYDSYKGVIAYVRIMEGKIKSTDVLRMLATKLDLRPVEIGIFVPGCSLWKRLALAKWVTSPLDSRPCMNAAWATRSRSHPRLLTNPCLGTTSPSRWSSLASIPLKRMITPPCASRSINCNSTTLH